MINSMENVSYHQETESIVALLRGYLSVEEYKKNANEVLALAMDNKVSNIYFDVSYLMAFRPQTADWIKKEWFPRACKQGIKKIIFTKAKSTLCDLSIQSVNQSLEGIEIDYVDELENIEGLILPHKKRSNSRILTLV